MKITFLGTSCMQPTKERNHQGILLSYGSDNILVDCGEGIQRQLKIAGIKPPKITALLISHWHGDHILGIPGLIQTMGANEYNRKLKIYGPKGTKKYIKHMFDAFISKGNVDFEVFEVKEGVFFENEKYKLEAHALEHGVDTIGFRFVEKDKRRINVGYVKKCGLKEGPVMGNLQQGKDVTYNSKKIKADDATYVVKGKIVSVITDTLLCNNCYKIAEDSDILICESSYSSKLENKASEYMHLTGEQAGLIANKCNVKKLVLTHFSQRYKDTEEIEEDAKSVFENVVCAYDFMKISL